jgi:transcriptional regulator with XRE-family HTH domain
VRATHDGNQTEAGKDLKITQGHISAILRGERGPGLNTLIRLRHKTGATIDSMLGFASVSAADELVERLRATFELEVARARQSALDAKDALLEEQSKKRTVQPHGRGKTGAKKAAAGDKG